MKKLLSTISLCLAFACTFSQYTLSLDSGLRYVSGSVASNVYTLFPYNGYLYAAGDFAVAGSTAVTGMAKWDGTSWSAVNTSGLPLAVHSMVVYNGNLYAAGAYPVSPYSFFVSKFDGAQWTQIATGHLGSHGLTKSAMAVYNGNLYVGGGFDSINGTFYPGLARWNDTSWSLVGTNYGLSQANNYSLSTGAVYAMQLFNNKLYVAGTFQYRDTLRVNSIAAWDDVSWNTVGKGPGIGIDVYIGSVQALAVYNGQLFAGGDEQSIADSTVTYSTYGPSCANLQRLDDTGWVDINKNYIWQVFCMLPINNTLLAAGGGWLPSYVCSPNGSNNVGSYTGSVIEGWPGAPIGLISPAQPFDPNHDGDMGQVYAMAEYNNVIYMAGHFDIDGISPGNRWSIFGVANATGINNLSAAGGLTLYPNPGTSQLTIQNLTPGTEIIISNILGQQLIKTIATNDKTIVDISHLPAGIYLANHIKFIKE